MDFVCAGYFLTKRIGPGRPGAGYLTLSPDRTPFYPDTWAISWAQVSDEARQSRAAALGLPPGSLQTLVPETTALFDRHFFWPNFIRSVLDAKDLVRLLPPLPGLTLLGCEIATDEADRLLRAHPPAPRDPSKPQVRPGGMLDMLRLRRPLEDWGSQRGFDVLCIDHGLIWHTHLDLNLARSAYDTPLTVDGLLPEYADATRAVEVLRKRDMTVPPRVYVPARIVSYDQALR
ncbi:MAG: hypothetical protein JST92_08560 [Deltaproteobacteria bacterium]|nr:hypothetical protein [Deltaproteobacteria bacterium]